MKLASQRRQVTKREEPTWFLPVLYARQALKAALRHGALAEAVAEVRNAEDVNLRAVAIGRRVGNGSIGVTTVSDVFCGGWKALERKIKRPKSKRTLHGPSSSTPTAIPVILTLGLK